MNRICGDLRAWAWAGGIGALAGLFDATAVFLHPVAPRAIPFAIFAYALLGLLAHLLGRLALVWFPPKAARPILLTLQTAGLVVFFAAYGASTATGGWVASRTGLLVIVALGGLGGLVLGVATAKAYLRSTHRAARLGVVLLLLSMAIYPIAFGIAELARDSGSRGRGVILVSLDAARGDRVSALGYSRPTTPNLDALVRGGVAYTEAIVQCPGSGPSHASLLTGLSPLSHKLLANSDVLADEVDTVAERLRQAGFTTAAFANNFYIDGRYGFDQGFDTFVNQYRAWMVKSWHPHHLLRTTSVYQAYHRFTRVPGAKNNDSLDGALHWLADRGSDDFFLFLHFMDPHAPYDAPPAIRDRFYQPQGERVRDTEELRARLSEASPEEIAALVDLYDASVALADSKLGRLVAGLKDLRLFDNSLLIVTADHGEVLDEGGAVFDHGLPGQGNLHVPLVLHWPAVIAPSAPVEGVVNSTRLVPTLLELAGLGASPESLIDADGSVRGVLGPVYGLTGVAPSDVSFAYDGRLKLLLRQGRIVGLYDLHADPLETQDLSAVMAQDPVLLARARTLETGLLDWIERQLAEAVVLERRTDTAIDAQTRRSLEALGYID